MKQEIESEQVKMEEQMAKVEAEERRIEEEEKRIEEKSIKLAKRELKKLEYRQEWYLKEIDIIMKKNVMKKEIPEEDDRKVWEDDFEEVEEVEDAGVDVCDL